MRYPCIGHSQIAPIAALRGYEYCAGVAQAVVSLPITLRRGLPSAGPWDARIETISICDTVNPSFEF